MKTLLFLTICLLVAFPIVQAQTLTGVLDQGLSVNCVMASSVALTVGTSNSSVITLNSKSTSDEEAFVNYAAGAHILVMGKQVADSINAVVYLRVGQNVYSGTEGIDYGIVYIDTLLPTRKVINIDLSAYLDYKQVAVRVIGITGVSQSTRLATWSAIFGGKGVIGMITKSGKAPTLQ
jgi:hypothetical protein